MRMITMTVSASRLLNPNIDAPYRLDDWKLP
jgi:hypothetical protein